MASGELIPIGYIIKTHGVKGQLRITLNDHIKELSAGEALFVYMKGNPEPFFIREIEYLSETEVFVLFEDVTSPETAFSLTKKELFGREELIETKSEQNDEIDLTGYILSDEHGKVLGPVEVVFEMGEYQLLQLTVEGREILIPFHDNLLRAVNHQTKQINLEIPEGIFDI